MEPCKLSIGVELCQWDLQNSFVAEYMKKSNTIDFANTSGLTPEFLAHYYERLGAKLNDNLERLTFQGNTGLTSSSYLRFCDGLEVQLSSDSEVIDVAATASAISSSNVIAELTKVYNAIPSQLDKNEVIMLVSSDIMSAYKVAVAQASAELYLNRVPSANFIDVQIVEAKGMSAKKAIATRPSNLIFLTDLVTPASELITINMKTTTGDRKLRTISDFTFGVNFVNPIEIVYYN
jgi:hypothetical protein